MRRFPLASLVCLVRRRSTWPTTACRSLPASPELSLRGRRIRDLKKSMLSRGAQTCRQVSKEPRSPGELTIGVPVQIQRLSALSATNAWVTCCQRTPLACTLCLGVLHYMPFVGDDTLPLHFHQRSPRVDSLGLFLLAWAGEVCRGDFSSDRLVRRQYHLKSGRLHYTYIVFFQKGRVDTSLSTMVGVAGQLSLDDMVLQLLLPVAENGQRADCP